MHIGIFSYLLGREGGPAIFDQRILETIENYDNRNIYTVYTISEQATRGIQFKRPNFSIRTIKPSGKWLATTIGLNLELRRNPIDILHATLVAPPKVPCKLITTLTCWSQYDQPKLYPPLLRWRIRYLSTKSIQNAIAVFCYTDFLKNKLIEKFHLNPERIFLIQPGVGKEMTPIEDNEFLSSSLKKIGLEKPYILFVGKLTRRKNAEGLIRAYNILIRETNIPHKLILIGERGFLCKGIFQTIEELDLTEHVIFLGRRTHRELPLFYNGAAVFVFPTLYEGFGLPPLEAMACGTPVVASNATSVPEVVGDAAVLVDPYRPEDIASGIYKCLTDSDLRADLIRRGIAQASKFTWERAAIQTLTAYKKVYEAGW